MGSLRMYRSGDDAPLRRFPDGCFIRTYCDTHDILPWAEICRAGQLLAPDGDAGTDFRNVILHHPGLHCYRDLFFVVRRTDRQLLATIAAIASTDDQNRRQGYLHMVAARPETRGRHIGSAMIAYALRKLFLDRVEYTILDTDDFRLPAIRTYLRAGFFPVAREGSEADEMFSRWSAILENLDLHRIPLCDADGRPITLLRP